MTVQHSILYQPLIAGAVFDELILIIAKVQPILAGGISLAKECPHQIIDRCCCARSGLVDLQGTERMLRHEAGKQVV